MSVFDCRVEGKGFVEIIRFARPKIVVIVELADLGRDLPDLPPLQIVLLIQDLRWEEKERGVGDERMSRGRKIKRS